MEIEAKFRIPDERTFQRLLEATSLAGFSLDEGHQFELRDRYYDTADGALRGGGYALRLRRQDDCHLATLKELGSATGALHYRVEHEVELPESLLPADWPPGAIRDLALRLSRHRPLIPLFEIRQIRHLRLLRDGDRAVAEMTLDRVDLLPRNNAPAANYLELEAELLPDGGEQDLRVLATDLHERWGLAPETHSKFERGLALRKAGDRSPEETR